MGVKRLLVEHRDHVLAERLAHLAARDRARVHDVVRDPDEVDAALARLILEQAVQTADVLARHVVVHDDDVRVELLAHLPALVEQVDIAAVGVRAHHHLLVAAREIGQRLLLVADGDGQVAEHGLHVVDAGDAPAVLRPVGEVGIVVCGARPDEAAVFRLGRVGRLVLLVALEHHLRDAQVRLVHELVHARRRLELIFALQRQRRAADLRVVGAVDVPLFDHAARGVVVHLGVFPEGIPVPL